MGKQKFLQYKTLVFFYENKCFPCVKLLFYTIKNHKYLYVENSFDGMAKTLTKSGK